MDDGQQQLAVGSIVPWRRHFAAMSARLRLGSTKKVSVNISEMSRHALPGSVMAEDGPQYVEVRIWLTAFQSTDLNVGWLRILEDDSKISIY